MDEEHTIDLADFWAWLMTHPNCILRAGTPEAVVYDDQDIHWAFGVEEPETLVVQAVRGKRPLGEILVVPEQVAWVKGFTGDLEGEYIFELMSESDAEPFAAYFFVMSHGLDDEDPGTKVH
jgi:hypothetical protein